MEVTATEAKNRLGQVLEACQREPVIIEKSGRRHSVLLSISHYDALVAAAKAARSAPPPRTADEFYGRYKDWVDEQNRLVAEVGVFGEEFRPW